MGALQCLCGLCVYCMCGYVHLVCMDYVLYTHIYGVCIYDICLGCVLCRDMYIWCVRAVCVLCVCVCVCVCVYVCVCGMYRLSVYFVSGVQRVCGYCVWIVCVCVCVLF